MCENSHNFIRATIIYLKLSLNNHQLAVITQCLLYTSITYYPILQLLIINFHIVLNTYLYSIPKYEDAMPTHLPRDRPRRWRNSKICATAD